jgi:hypothetical protein
MGRKSKIEEDKKSRVSISISRSNYDNLVDEKTNKSKLINWLLEQHFGIINSELDNTSIK